MMAVKESSASKIKFKGVARWKDIRHIFLKYRR